MQPRLLIVDDEQGIVDMMASYFSPHFEVLTAYNGNEALQKLKSKPDLILLDINMPGMDGDLNWTNVDFVNDPFAGCTTGGSWAPGGYALVGQEINKSYKDNIDNHTLVR